ncbi:MAG: glycosyltransferase family 2 protein [Bacteroidia bacterium]|nr:glycosyltransferase family 2 protein [Bacteroidia bacterium]
MPVFNAAHFICDALNMVQAQTINEWELVIVDDFSTDDTVNIIQDLMSKEKRILFSKNEKNWGPSYSRNKAISMANGEWIAIVDADDFIEKERLEKMIDWGEKYELDLVGDNQRWVDVENGNYMRSLFSNNFITPPFKTINIKSYLNSVSKVQPKYTFGMVQPIIKLDFLKTNQITYQEDIRFGEDTVLHFDCLMKGAIFGVFEDEMYTCRKRNKKNATHSKHTASNQRMINKHFWKSAIDHKKYNLLPLVFKRMLAMFVRMIKQNMGDTLRPVQH